MASAAEHDADERDEVDESDSDDDFLRAVARAPEISPASSRAPLTRIAHFKITGELGRGGMGIVYRAQDEKLERVVALKVLAHDFDADPARRRRFLREAKLAASITHPNVATVHEIGESDDRIYIAMELVQGKTLRESLEQTKPRGLPIAEALRITKEIARGVARAHTLQIAHRDLKPDNVIVGSDGSVKVLDFGLAKPTEPAREKKDDDEAPTVTQEGRIMGTPGYMSPEQGTGKPLDVRTDVFSLGVVLYELVSGRRPFVGDTPMDIVISASRDLPAPLSAPPSLSRIVARCLEKDPLARYADAAELLTALEAVDPEEKEPIVRNRRALAWLAVPAAAVVMGAIAYATSSKPATATATSTSTSTSTSTPTSTSTSTSTATSTSTPTLTSDSNSNSNLNPSSSSTAPPPPNVAIAKPVRPRPASPVSPPPVAAAPPTAPAASPPAAGGGVIQTSPY